MKVQKVTWLIIRAEMLLDSAQQSREPHEIKQQKAAVALAYLRAIRAEFQREYGWQWTLTAPNLPKTRAAEIKRFGAIQKKRWEYNPKGQVKLTERELAMIEA